MLSHFHVKVGSALSHSWPATFRLSVCVCLLTLHPAEWETSCTPCPRLSALLRASIDKATLASISLFCELGTDTPATPAENAHLLTHTHFVCRLMRRSRIC